MIFVCSSYNPKCNDIKKQLRFCITNCILIIHEFLTLIPIIYDLFLTLKHTLAKAAALKLDANLKRKISSYPTNCVTDSRNAKILVKIVHCTLVIKHTKHEFLTLKNYQLHLPNQIWVKNIYFIIYIADHLALGSFLKSLKNIRNALI